MTMGTSKVLRLPGKLQHIFWKRRKSIAPATQNDFRHVAKHVWMSRSATPATRNEATPHVKPPKVTPFAELTIGTAIWWLRGQLRTVTNGCGRLRTVANINATSSELTFNPQTPRVKREPLLRIRENTQTAIYKHYTNTIRTLYTIQTLCPLYYKPSYYNICRFYLPASYSRRFATATARTASLGSHSRGIETKSIRKYWLSEKKTRRIWWPCIADQRSSKNN